MLMRMLRPFLLYGGLIFTVIHRAVIAGMLLLLTHLFVVTIVPVRGDSMLPTLSDKRYLLVDQLSPRLRALARGDIVAFRYPADPRQKFIKRIIAEPNEVIEITQESVILKRSTDGGKVRLREPYLNLGTHTEGLMSTVVGPANYFVMGDNRPVSLDSRVFGPVSRELMLGRAWMVIWPLTETRLISHFDPIIASIF